MAYNNLGFSRGCGTCKYFDNNKNNTGVCQYHKIRTHRELFCNLYFTNEQKRKSILTSLRKVLENDFWGNGWKEREKLAKEKLESYEIDSTDSTDNKAEINVEALNEYYGYGSSRKLWERLR